MGATLDQPDPSRLEGLCADATPNRRAGNRIVIGSGAAGIERMAARFTGPAFSPHRHDSYAIGVTLSGVQTFRYRGERHHCLPGECHILFPDEIHDGAPGTEEGFCYRILYLDPWLLRQALGGETPPFLPDPVLRSRRLANRLLSNALALWEPVDDVKRTDIALAAADLLRIAGPGSLRREARLCPPALLRVRERIATDPATLPTASELERISGLDRWTLARQFRAAFGTSPSRFRTLRQLERARAAIRSGLSLAESALDAGFADQSHLTRQFRRAYGLTPAGWAAALSEPRSGPPTPS